MKLATSSCESDRSIARSLPRFVDRGADVDVVVAAAVVVEQRLAVVDAVRPFGDDRAGLPLGAVEHRLDRGVGDRPAELRGQRQKAPLADMGRADHRREIAAEIARMAHIGRDHLQHVAAHLAAVVEPQRRDADAFLPDVGGGGVVGAVRRPADIALMGAVDRPEARAPSPGVLEHRHEGGQVGQVVAAVIGIVEQKYVARWMSPPKNSVTALAAKGSAPTWIGTCSAWAISRPSRSQIAVEKSRLELRICE